MEKCTPKLTMACRAHYGMDKWELHSCGVQSSLNAVGCCLGSPTTVKHRENCNFDEVADVFNWACFVRAELLPVWHRAACSLGWCKGEELVSFQEWV